MKCLHAWPLLLLLASSGAIAQDDRDRGDDIQLICYGGAEKPTAEVRSGVEWDARAHKYVPKQTVETGKSDFQATINVSIHGGRGDIHLPKSLIPPINGGGDNGWWPIDDLSVDHDEIRGAFRLNALNHPRLSISRMDGAITIDGLIKFNGRCDVDDGHRRF